MPSRPASSQKLISLDLDIDISDNDSSDGASMSDG